MQGFFCVRILYDLIIADMTTSGGGNSFFLFIINKEQQNDAYGFEKRSEQLRWFYVHIKSGQQQRQEHNKQYEHNHWFYITFI